MDNLMLKIMSYLKENQVCNFAKPIHKYLAKIHLKRLFCEHSYPSMSKGNWCCQNCLVPSWSDRHSPCLQ